MFLRLHHKQERISGSVCVDGGASSCTKLDRNALTTLCNSAFYDVSAICGGGTCEKTVGTCPLLLFWLICDRHGCSIKLFFYSSILFHLKMCCIVLRQACYCVQSSVHSLYTSCEHLFIFLSLPVVRYNAF